MKNLLNKKIDDLSFEEAYRKLTEIVEKKKYRGEKPFFLFSLKKY